MRKMLFFMPVFLITLLPAVAGAQSPSQAQQEEYDNYITPYYARNFGGKLFENRSATDGFGLAYTFWARGVLSGEFDFGYNPEFFGSKDELGSNSNLITFTVNGIIGPWIQMGSARVRPYVVLGGGLMRSKIDEFKILGADTKNKGMIDAGGGVLFLANKRVGVRGEVRYLLGVGANDSSDGWGLIDDWNYLRASGGVVLAF